MSSKPAPYEFHVTVEKAQIRAARFINASRELGVKAIVLDLGVNNCSDLKDYMTSSTQSYESDAEAFTELSRIAIGLSGGGFSVIRRKIETVPWHYRAPQVEGDTMPEGCYFEAHLAVSCPVDEVPALREGIQASAEAVPLHLSRNQFKPEQDGKVVMMATLREGQNPYSDFSKDIAASQDLIHELGFELAKPPITEFAMYDSNVHQDDAWMTV